METAVIGLAINENFAVLYSDKYGRIQAIEILKKVKKIVLVSKL